MKKETTKSTAKKAQETTRKSVQASLITELKAFAAKLGHSSKKIEKEIEKSAKALSKKLSKPVKADKITKKECSVEPKILTNVKAPKTAEVNKKSTAPANTAKTVKKEPVEKVSTTKNNSK